jgi:hypothetical protein
MNFGNKHKRERSERWEREDAAPRLSVAVPELSELRLELRETRQERVVPGTVSVRHVIVGRAAARFEFGCSEPGCEEGGFDVTSEIMSGLRRQAANFEGQCNCSGMISDRLCERTLVFVAHAEYR